MPLEHGHDLLLRRLGAWQSRLRRLVFLKLCSSGGLAILDVDVLELVHAIAAHGHLGSSLVGQKLLIAALVLCFVRL